MAGAEAGGAKTEKTAKKEKKPPKGLVKVVTEDVLRVRVVCAGVPATGLFLAYKVVLTPDAATIEKIFAAHDKAVAEDTDAQVLAAARARPGEEGFSLAFVDAAGFLQPVLPGSNPWREIFPEKKKKKKKVDDAKKGEAVAIAAAKSQNPHANPIAEGAWIKACLIRHPSPSVAQAIQRYLHTGVDAEKLGIAKWGDLLVDLRAEKASLKTGKGAGKALQLVLPTDAGSYVPKGHDVLGTWILYPDMPMAELDALKKATKEFSDSLGDLRYPFGTHGDFPYRGIETFTAGLMAATHQFQLDASAGKALKVSAASWAKREGEGGYAPDDVGALAAKDQVAALEAEGKKVPERLTGMTKLEKPSWAYLDVEKEAPGRVPHPASFEPGVVDEATAEAVFQWENQRLRKDGTILVQVSTDQGWNIWLRPEAAARLAMWRTLVNAFGGRYGIKFGHTFREIASPGGVGKAEFSIHKTGLAIDLAVKGGAGSKKAPIEDYSSPVATFPIRYEAHWDEVGLAGATKRLAQATKTLESAKREQENARLAVEKGKPSPTQARRRLALADAAFQKAQGRHADARSDLSLAEQQSKTTKENYKIRWRLYEHADWDAIADAAKAEEKSAVSGHAIRWELHERTAGLAGKLASTLTSFFPVAPAEGSPARAWVQTQEREFAAIVHDLEAMAPGELVATYFRSEIFPWKYNPYAADGGSRSKTPLAAKTDAGSVRYLDESLSTQATAGKKAEAYLNITALAYACGLFRIGAQSRGWRDPAERADLPPRRPIPIDDKSFASLAGLLERMRGTKHASDTIDVTRGESLRVLRASEIDSAFMALWARKVSKPPAHSHVAAMPQLDAEIFPEAGDREAIAALFDELADKRFAIASIGATVRATGLAVGDVATGAELAAAIRKAEVEAPPEPSKAGPKKKAPKVSRPKLRPEWTIGILPLFDEEAEDLDSATFRFDDSVDVPTPGIGRALEWWHYEAKEAQSRTWGELVGDIGYSTHVLKAPRVPPEDPSAGIFLRGLGYGDKDLDKTRGGARTGEHPENEAKPDPEEH